MMSIVFVIFSLFSISVLAHSVPKTSKIYSKAHHRSTSHVLKRKGMHYPDNANLDSPIKKDIGRGIASERGEKVKAIPWKKD
ncbi:MAG: hypothetical protein WDA09_04170 [Bacteriovoracaceae bacterium]